VHQLPMYLVLTKDIRMHEKMNQYHLQNNISAP